MAEKLSLKDQCLEDLKARILKMELRPGTPLEETPLCQQYGLSRTPMREVFQRLAGAGFISLSPGRGAEVAEIELARLRQFFQSAPLLHALIAKQAAENIDPVGLDALKVAQAAARRARVSRNAAAMALADYGFHFAVCQVSGNPYLGPSLERLLIDQTRMSVAFYSGHSAADNARIDHALAEHERLIEAISHQQAKHAVALAIQHWDGVKGHVETYVQPAPLADEAGLLDDL